MKSAKVRNGRIEVGSRVRLFYFGSPNEVNPGTVWVVNRFQNAGRCGVYAQLHREDAPLNKAFAKCNRLEVIK